MKKFLLFATLLAFGAVSAFADISFGGSLVGNWVMVEDEAHGDNDDLSTHFVPYNGGTSNSVRGRFNVTAVNEANTFGGWMQFRAQASGNADFRMLNSVWWKPLDMLKITYGYMWGGANPIGVVLTDDDVLAMKFYGRSANYISWGYEVLSGAHVELTPVENLYVLASVPLDNSGNLNYNGWDTPYVASKASAEDIFKHTMARFAYTMPGTGTARLTVAGGTGNVTDALKVSDPASGVPNLSLGTVDATVLDLGFTFNALENCTLDFGIEIPIAGKNWLTESENDPDIKAQVPIALNLRANASVDKFNFAGGLSAKFGGNAEVSFSNNDGGTDKIKFEQGFIFGLTLNPAYDAGVATVGVVAELEYNAEDKFSGDMPSYTYDSRVNWSIIPYIQKNVITGGTVYAGFQIGSNLVKSDSSPSDRFEWDSGFDWSIPIGFLYYF
ncbi:MAG: hypothetical protein LBC27_05360 [Spirochaetaceae bacterium]|nr:hypothetical protein [Spirochaetaceae bacterium]